MIAIDTNILVYAHRRDAPFHAKAKDVVTGLAEGQASWAIPWPCVHEFIAIVTHPRIYSPPSALDDAINQVDAWLESPSLAVLSESAAHWDVLRQTLASAKISGPRVHDARVIALCAQHGVRELWSADRDFNRFSGVRVVNPLV